MKNQNNNKNESRMLMILFLIAGMMSSFGGWSMTTCACNPDEHPAKIWYLDSDGDGLGDAFNAMLSCDQPFRYVDNNLDADDTMPADLQLSAGIMHEWYLDADGDGFGDPLQVMIADFCPAGYVADSSDENDQNDAVWFAVKP